MNNIEAIYAELQAAEGFAAIDYTIYELAPPVSASSASKILTVSQTWRFGNLCRGRKADDSKDAAESVARAGRCCR